MNRQYFFLSGFPRSGETLLSSILNQNPDIHLEPESPVCNLITNTLICLNQTEQHILYPKPNVYKHLSKSIIDGYYYDTNKKYVIDKCRVWSSSFNINLIRDTLTKNVKIICCVRNVLEILSSYISLIHRSPENFIDKNLKNLGIDINDNNRCDWLMKEDGLIMLSYNSLKETHKLDCIHIIEYDDLVGNTRDTIQKIYNFFELPHYDHRFNNVSNPFITQDSLLGIPELHYVRSEIEKTSIVPEKILSKYVLEKYKNMEFWR